MVTKGPTHYFLWLPHIRIYFRYNGYIDESDTQYKGIHSNEEAYKNLMETK